MTEQQPNRTQQPIVYIRKVDVADLPDELQVRAKGIQSLYAIGGENGERIALVKDRDHAFIVARQNNLLPVSVH